MNKWRPGGRKPTLTKAEVAEIANTFVAGEAAKRERQHGVKVIYELIGVTFSLEVGEWVATFGVKTAEGHMTDGPALVLVDDNTREAWFY